jgi:hypothetical protein
MQTEKNLRLYTAYVGEAISAGAVVMNFDQWYKARFETRKTHFVMRWSEATKAHVTFRIEADDIYQANQRADALLKDFESRHTIEVSHGKFLTPAEQSALMDKKIAAAQSSLQKALDRKQKKIDEMKKKLEALGIK